MAPEVFEEKYDSKADIWSVGCVAFQMATGKPPWQDLGLSNQVLLHRHVSQTTGPPPLDSISVPSSERLVYSSFYDVATCCFQRDVALRPSAHELLTHKFFTLKLVQSDDDLDGQDSRGLFSPSSTCSRESLSSPYFESRINSTPPRSNWRNSIRRCNSSDIVPFLSPPLPSGSVAKRSKSASDCLNSTSSPCDPTDWPTWAKHKFVESNSDQTQQTSQGDIKSVDSLAYSDDAAGNHRPLPTSTPKQRKSVNGIHESPLLGLDLIGSLPVTEEEIM